MLGPDSCTLFPQVEAADPLAVPRQSWHLFLTLFIFSYDPNQSQSKDGKIQKHDFLLHLSIRVIHSTGLNSSEGLGMSAHTGSLRLSLETQGHGNPSHRATLSRTPDPHDI